MVYVTPVGFRPRSIPAALYQTRFQFNIEKGKTMGRLFLHRAGRGLLGVFIYMFVDEIPKTSVGKINKVQLRKQFI